MALVGAPYLVLLPSLQRELMLRPRLARLFYIEGTVTMFVAVIATFVLPDFPATTSWLTPLERRLAEVRVAEDVGESDSDNTGALRGLYLALTDWKVWWLSVASAVQSVAFS